MKKGVYFSYTPQQLTRKGKPMAVGLLIRIRSMKGFLFLALTVLLISCKPTGPRQIAQQEPRSATPLLVIHPYRSQGTWVFDDLGVGLVREPFVAGIPQMIDKLVQDIPGAEKGFRLLFSATPFPGYMTRLVWQREEAGGNWYFSEDYGSEGWLCPALFKYFKTAPREIYVRAEGK
jgi:hypothetical protein